MPRLLTFVFLLSITLLRAQNLSFCGNCSWESEGFQSIWEQYVTGDTAAARMKVASVRIAVTKDTLSAGISMRNMNDPNCNECRLVRYDAMGREEFVFFNSPAAMGGMLIKKQYVYDEQNRPKYVLTFMKNPMSEEDTAYHMTQYSLIAYYNKFSISKTYSSEGTGFSATPKQQPISVTTKTFDDKGRVLMKKTAFTGSPERNDSIVYHYDPFGAVSCKTYLGKVLVSNESTTSDGNYPQVRRDSTLHEQLMETHYLYDSQNRLRSVNQNGTGDIQRFCGGITTTEIRYDKNGLPLLIVFRGRGDYCALAFYYSYYQ